MGSSDDSSGNDDKLQGDPPLEGRVSRGSLPGYELGQLLGEGGMGEVVVARDPKFGRDVAVKRMRTATPTPEMVERFLREAKIQARLDHPAVVPVFDLGHDAEGCPYFTMKRLAGKTLHELLLDQSDTQQRMLRAFVDVCLAVQLAHDKGVVHRDLKPSNIMLGDYGEVYVLDWGIARIIAQPEASVPHAGSPSVVPDTATQVGALLGTPGYMAPEQARGEVVGPAADVYALGCILFEVLTGESKHPRGAEALASTLATPTEAPAQRRADRAIAPELDEACQAALAANRHVRPTARALADRVQSYLDGDRDLERRRELAREQLAAAHEAARDPSRHADAIRSAGRALALDPESRETAELVGRLMLEPPTQLPAELQQQLVTSDAATYVQGSSIAAKVLLAPLATIPLVLWAGVRSWPAFAGIFGLVGALALHAYLETRAERTHARRTIVLAALL